MATAWRTIARGCGAYGGMAKNYHVKLAGSGLALTTKMQFPEDSEAFRIDPRRVIEVARAGQCIFDLVLS